MTGSTTWLHKYIIPIQNNCATNTDAKWKVKVVIFKFQNSIMVLELLYLCLSIPCIFSLNLICKFYKKSPIISITTKQEEKKLDILLEGKS